MEKKIEIDLAKVDEKLVEQIEKKLESGEPKAPRPYRANGKKHGGVMQ